jgi:NodT family efflux transporter outer membrane factor (OMF) lipoprotein
MTRRPFPLLLFLGEGERRQFINRTALEFLHPVLLCLLRMPPSLKWKTALYFGMLVVLAGCVPKATPVRFYSALPETFRNTPATTGSVHQGKKAPFRQPQPVAWWARGRDKHLTHLVERALRDNPRLEQAQARLATARALTRAEALQTFPLFTETGKATLTRRLSGKLEGLNEKGEEAGQPPLRAIGTYERTAAMAWDIDLFGRARSAVRAAQASSLMAQEELNAARIDLISETVRSYVELRGAQARRLVLARDAGARGDIAEMTRRRQAAGIAGAYDVQRAVSSAEATRARLPSVELETEKALQRLASLIGSPVANPSLMIASPLPSLSLPEEGLPLDLLRTRADIRVAEWRVIRQAAQRGVAEADLYPRLTLSGTLTLSGNLVGQPLVGRVIDISGGPSFSVPLLDWGQRQSLVVARDAELKEALAQYREAVIKAVEETEIALATIRQSRERITRFQAAAHSARSALDMSDRLFRNGLIGIEERLSAESEYRAAELSLIEAREAAAIAVVGLYRALGGPDGV